MPGDVIEEEEGQGWIYDFSIHCAGVNFISNSLNLGFPSWLIGQCVNHAPLKSLSGAKVLSHSGDG